VLADSVYPFENERFGAHSIFDGRQNPVINQRLKQFWFATGPPWSLQDIIVIDVLLKYQG